MLGMIIIIGLHYTDRISNFILGSLVYVQSENIDKLKSKKINTSNIGQDLFSKDGLSIRYAYIEPNLVFIREMRANLRMLKSIFSEIGISSKVDFVKINLDEAVDYFDYIVDIVEKELKGEVNML